MTDDTGRLVPFEYGDAQVRVVMIDDEPWFVLADLCKVLGLTRSASAVAERLGDGVRQAYPISDSLGRTQQASIVSEPGMYEVVIRSDKPEAVAFRRWITGEVLPSIRKTGGYATRPAINGADITRLELIEIARNAETERLALEAENKTLADKVAEDAPKVNYVELYVADADLMKLRTVAASNDVGEDWLRDLLLEKGWIYVETERRWSNSKECMEIRRRYSAYSHKRPYFRPAEVHEAPRFRGEVMHTLKITPVGAEAIARLINRERAA